MRLWEFVKNYFITEASEKEKLAFNLKGCRFGLVEELIQRKAEWSELSAAELQAFSKMVVFVLTGLLEDARNSMEKFSEYPNDGELISICEDYYDLIEKLTAYIQATTNNDFSWIRT